MTPFQAFRRHLRQGAARQRLALSHAEALIPMSLLGIITGLCAGAVIVALRLLIEAPQRLAPLLEAQLDAPQTLALRLAALPAAALAIWLLFRLLRRDSRHTGVAHVLEHLTRFQARLPLPNLIGQFGGTVLALLGGFSVGREGPGVHLGAGTGSQLGIRLDLPHNSVRTLMACGAAAAIAASFNTPLAGVVFSMEVLIIDYSIAGFTPVMLAAVSGTVLTRLVFGASPAFAVPTLGLASLTDLFAVLLVGVLCGVLAGLFIRLLERFVRLGADWPPWRRLLLAALLSMPCAWLLPEAMGLGYDTLGATLDGRLELQLLFAIAVVKIFATTAAVGLGVPGGLIGPSLVIGAAAAGALALLLNVLLPGQVHSSPALLAMVGMGAMMGAVLQAPLAALIALLEMTYNPDIILPGLLGIVTANLVTREGWHREGVFARMLRARGLEYRYSPMAQWLQREGAAAAADPSFAMIPRRCERTLLDRTLVHKPRWLLIHEHEQPLALLPAARLTRHVEATTDTGDAGGVDGDPSSAGPAATFDAGDFEEEWLSLARCDANATLYAATSQIDAEQLGAVYVQTARGLDGILGVITRDALQKYYR